MPLKRLFGRAPADPDPDPDAPAAHDPAALRASLQSLVQRVNRSAGRLPVGAVPEIREIADRLFELLDHATRVTTAGGGVDTYAMATIASTVTDYLPTSVESYLSLPESFLEAHVNDDGQTPAEELLEHLELMEKGVEDLANAIYSGDAQRLEIQGRFLDTKFSKSDLDLS
jgi:hypothetical protein